MNGAETPDADETNEVFRALSCQRCNPISRADANARESSRKRFGASFQLSVSQALGIPLSVDNVIGHIRCRMAVAQQPSEARRRRRVFQNQFGNPVVEFRCGP